MSVMDGLDGGNLEEESERDRNWNVEGYGP